jgi:hypothetical protein
MTKDNRPFVSIFAPGRRLVLSLALLLAVLGFAREAQAQTIQINFQPRSVAVPSGYLRDSGDVYGNRGNGYSYGWNRSHTSRTYYYEPFAWTPNPYWSNIFMLAGTGTSWEIALPNANYEVHIAAGGWQSANVLQRITAEGVVIVDAVGTDYGPWVGGTQTVSVSDGKLTVKNGAGASNNSICLIRITRL